MIIVTNSDLLGKNIRHLRRKNYLTRRKLALLVRWDAASIRNMEKGTLREIEKDTLFLLCRLFDMDCMTLMTTELKKKIRCE